MAFRLTEDLMRDSFEKYLTKDETELYPIYAIKQNWFVTWLSKYYFIAVTNKRLFIMRVSTFLKEKSFMEVKPEEIKSAAINKGALGSIIEIYMKDGRFLKARVNKTVLGLGSQKQNLEKIKEYIDNLPV
ncbi:PH domain-containing protein [Clostridium polynesiense]|uniref:PH domain-containing protein n=1 Tax=Clostridium polynesiense TaxID=1325933 RepID=UPI00058E1E4A|nr:PH domain-containing protein [Clostridium polynesiense]